MTFLEAYRASDRGRAAEPDAGQTALIADWLTSRPAALFDELLDAQPTWQVGRLAFVTRHADVADVLGRTDAFSVAPYRDAITYINRGPNFLLGMDDGPEYRAELALLHRVFRRDDAGWVSDLVAARASALIEAARAEGRLELTDGYARPAAAAFAVGYLGVDVEEPSVLADWARAIFTDAFVNVMRLPLLTRRAMRASDAWRARLDEVIAREKDADSAASETRDLTPERSNRDLTPPTVLRRFLDLQAQGEAGLTDARVRDILLWCTAGMIDNVNTATSSALDRLLGLPDVLPDAIDAARSGDASRLWFYVREALRFRTPTPVVARRCIAPVTMSQGLSGEMTIQPGTLVLAGLGTAMKDPSVVDDPAAFRIDRPDRHYLHFGAGLHACLGTHLAGAIVTALVGAVLRLDGLRREKGLIGRYRAAGPFPKRFMVRFTP